MRYLTHVPKTYNYTAEWYSFTGDVISGRVYEVAPSGTISFTGGEGAGGNIKAFTDTVLEDFVRIDNFKGSDGTLIYPDYRSNGAKGVTFEVRNMQPVLNIWGYSEGYRMMLVRI